jgi:hypothetical protein
LVRHRCAICERPFLAIRTAKTCSAVCRKRLSRMTIHQRAAELLAKLGPDLLPPRDDDDLLACLLPPVDDDVYGDDEGDRDAHED